MTAGLLYGRCALPFPGLTGELQTERMARRLETPTARAQLAEAIRPKLGDARAVGLPAVLGIARHPTGVYRTPAST